MEGHVTFYSSQKVDGQSSNPKVGDGSTNHHDVHDDTLVVGVFMDQYGAKHGECQGKRLCFPTN